MLKEVPVFDRPREKAIKYGVNSLSNIELIAILLRTGSKQDNVLDVAKNLMYDIEKDAKLKSLDSIMRNKVFKDVVSEIEKGSFMVYYQPKVD